MLHPAFERITLQGQDIAGKSGINQNHDPAVVNFRFPPPCHDRANGSSCGCDASTTASAVILTMPREVTDGVRI